MASSQKASSDMIIVSDSSRSVLEVGCGDGWFTRLLGKDGQHPPLILASVNIFGEEN
jgi:phospholipid N-methyltransferase